MFFSLNSSPCPLLLGREGGRSKLEALEVPFSFYKRRGFRG